MTAILDFFLSPAYADTVQAGSEASNQQGGGLSLMMMMGFIIFFVYFMILRPNSKRAKEQRTLMSSLVKGDEVMAAGGMLGRITKLTDRYIGLSIGNNVEIVVLKSSVVSVLPKGTIKSIEG